MQIPIERLRSKPRLTTPNLTLNDISRRPRPNIRLDEAELLAARYEITDDQCIQPTPLLLRVAITAGIVLVMIGLAILVWTEGKGW